MPVDFEPYRIEPFGKEHEDGLISLIERIYAEYGQKIELATLDSDLLRIPKVYAPPAGTFQVLVDGERLIGSVAVMKSGKDEAELKRVYVSPSYRRRGLGRKLSLWAYEWARERGCSTLMVWSDTLYENAHHLYRGLGAEDTGRRRTLGGVNEVDEFLFIWEIA
jgi:GNAT superfamily N-acetyltransferase